MQATCVFDDDGNPFVTTSAFKKNVNSLMEAFRYAPPQTLSYNVEKTVKDFYLGNGSLVPVNVIKELIYKHIMDILTQWQPFIETSPRSHPAKSSLLRALS